MVGMMDPGGMRGIGGPGVLLCYTVTSATWVTTPFGLLDFGVG